MLSYAVLCRAVPYDIVTAATTTAVVLTTTTTTTSTTYPSAQL